MADIIAIGEAHPRTAAHRQHRRQKLLLHLIHDRRRRAGCAALGAVKAQHRVGQRLPLLVL